ncbi:transglutaminase, partial [Streptococcus pneumoniae]|nr:transglutaminase [Streptococcus pneumoniae]
AKYKKARKKVKEIVKDIIKDQMSDREKVEAINQYMIEHISYDKAAYQGFLNYKTSIENKESEEAISKAFKDMQDGIRK